MKDPCTLFQMYASIATILPSCLHYKLTRYTAQVVDRTNSICDAISYVSHDQTIAATCYLYKKSLSTFLDWPTAYTLVNDSSIIIQALRHYTSTSIPLDMIHCIHMSFRSYFKKGNIVLLGKNCCYLKL